MAEGRRVVFGNSMVLIELLRVKCALIAVMQPLRQINSIGFAAV